VACSCTYTQGDVSIEELTQFVWGGEDDIERVLKTFLTLNQEDPEAGKTAVAARRR
jgi:hypothetical protein